MRSHLNGQMGMLYSYGREPWVPAEEFPKENLPPDRTPLAEALKANHLSFCTSDLTPQDYALALRRKAILLELKPQFESEGIMFIYENRLGDAQGVCQCDRAGSACALSIPGTSVAGRINQKCYKQPFINIRG